MIGLHPHTLRKYADSGLIQSIWTSAGQRLFAIETFISSQQEASVIVYARVSSRKQQDDLRQQIEYLKSKEPYAEVISDIASGLNFKRKGLKTILERYLQGTKLRIVVAHRNRLPRFGFDLLEWLIERNGREIVVLSKSYHTNPTAELRQDLLAILSVFAARMHGLRKYRDEIAQDSTLSDSGAENNVS